MSKKEKEDTVILKATKAKMTSFVGSDGETEYPVDKDGFLEVPLSEKDNALSHNFREATEEDIAAPKSAAKK